MGDDNQDLADRIHELTKTDKATVVAVLDALSSVLRESLVANGKCSLPKVAEWRVAKKPATVDRPGINPFTKQPIQILGKPASLRVHVTVARALEDEVASALGVECPRYEDVSE